MKKRSFLWVMLIVMSLFVLTACGESRSDVEEASNNNSNEPAEQEEVDLEANKPDSLKVWVNDESTQREALQTIFDNFETEYGIKVDVTPMNMLDQIEALALDAPAGNGPDIFFQPHDRIGNIVSSGLAEPVSIDDVIGDYVDTAIDAVTYDGEYYGLPLVVETYATYYNKSLVDKAPETMAEVMQIAEEQTNAGESRYGFLMEAANFYFTYPFFSGYGGYVFNFEDGAYDVSDIGLANEGALQGGELIQSWFANGYIPIEVNPDIMAGLFKDNKTAVVINGPWAMNEYREALGDDLGTVILPKLDNGETPKSFVGVKSWMLSSYSENKEWALELMKFITNAENSLHYFEAAGEMPANLEALESDVLTSNELIAAFAEQVGYGEPMPSAPEMQMVWEDINDALFFIANGQDVQESLEGAVRSIGANIEAAQ
ncbi:sugar ABC transporter substrate-binding protein [Bacillus horti]|uniref:Maltodextrin-binding protein n=1 Tax=Caldalkalibacillus horti TaxID=77523 RepID=A0ABT9W2N2_9BACI|nr:extracellular solute-binding protein [Bacillus horti]MDQ0167515.1 arabinogalactan oligomer/maltooligosaccharide transport system substrate-binding protein [Bacillus horti]